MFKKTPPPPPPQPKPKLTVASIMADFSQKISQLRQLAAQKSNEVAALDQQIAAAKQAQAEATEEGTKALAVASKIEELLAG